ncbi:hypothetical protein F0U62_32465 [Cystobacter fuscus]|uniref:hypothetical protein n=1 Tax=Cystobacter fuscus TaxID=43 RepID=UPI002B27D72C|nr:hypothetical protein F0U62_32465 [Cystobacter fuscus]
MLRRLALVLFACTCLSSTARAHDPFLAEIETGSTADTLVLRVLLARSVAAHLAELTPNPRVYFAPADFAARQANFDRIAKGLCLMSVNDRPLEPKKTEAALSRDKEEVVFTLTYPRPAATKVLLECGWLSRLPQGYAASAPIRVGSRATATDSLRLTAENPSGYLHLGSAPAPASSTP